MVEFEDAASSSEVNERIVKREAEGWRVQTVYPEIKDDRLTGFYWIVFRKAE